MKHCVVFGFSLWFLSLPGWCTEKGLSGSTFIRVTNYPDSNIVSYPLVLLSGELSNLQATEVRSRNITSSKMSRETIGQACQGKFRVLAELVPGDNDLQLLCEENSDMLQLNYVLRYVPNENPYKVKAVYMTNSIDVVPEHYRKKISTALKLMQTFVAEGMYELGYSRRTFSLEFDAEGEVVVHILHQVQIAENDSKEQWWWQCYRELQKHFPMERSKYLVLSSRKLDKDFVALGGGNVALFETPFFEHWPDRMDVIYSSMPDETTSNDLGTALHELGHTFGLSHTDDSHDLMYGNFHHFFRIFGVREVAGETEQPITRFAPVSAAALIVNPFFAENDPSDNDDAGIFLAIDNTRKVLIASAKNGVAFLEVLEKNVVKLFAAPSPEEVLCGQFPKTVEIPLEKIKQTIHGKRCDVRMLDAYGFGKEKKLHLEFHSDCDVK